MTPLQAAENPKVIGQAVVLHDAPILLLEHAQDREWRVLNTFGAVYRLAVLLVSMAFASEYIHGHAQADNAVYDAATGCIACRVVLENTHLIAEKAPSFCPRVSNQGLGFGKFQFEAIAQARVFE
jgi:hypothetical protein